MKPIFVLLALVAAPLFAQSSLYESESREVQAYLNRDRIEQQRLETERIRQQQSAEAARIIAERERAKYLQQKQDEQLRMEAMQRDISRIRELIEKQK